jgi:hypothetical protein
MRREIDAMLAYDHESGSPQPVWMQAVGQRVGPFEIDTVLSEDALGWHCTLCGQRMPGWNGLTPRLTT